ncbi:MAG: glycosyltransferase family 2 protein [Acidimicrobiales bacterium]
MNGSATPVPGTSSQRPTVSVLVPCGNDSLVVARSLAALARYLTALTDRYLFELVVVDDGSTDNTVQIARAFAVGRPWVKVVHHPVPVGYGRSLRDAIEASGGEYVVTYDVAMLYSVDHIERLLTAIARQGAQIAVASPHVPGGRITAVESGRARSERLTNRLLSRSAGGVATTVTGTVRAYDGAFVRALAPGATEADFDTEVLHLAATLGARVVEIPGHHDETGRRRRAVSRRVRMRTSIATGLRTFLAFRFRPLRAVAIPGLVLVAVGVWMLGSTAWDAVGAVQDASGSFQARVSGALARVWAERPQSIVIGGLCLVVALQLLGFGWLAARNRRLLEQQQRFGVAAIRRLDGARRIPNG